MKNSNDPIRNRTRDLLEHCLNPLRLLVHPVRMYYGNSYCGCPVLYSIRKMSYERLGCVDAFFINSIWLKLYELVCRRWPLMMNKL